MQLGKINHPIFGQAEASFTAQLTIPNNLFFGNHRQQFEDEPDDSDPNLIPENEKVKFVYLDIPFFTNQDDADNDGVIDSLDADPNDPLSNSDGDELTDLIEFQSQLNPLSSDSDGDGILDHNDDDNEDHTIININELDDYEERQMFLDELDLEEPGVNRLIRQAYTLLNLQTYFSCAVRNDVNILAISAICVLNFSNILESINSTSFEIISKFMVSIRLPKAIEV